MSEPVEGVPPEPWRRAPCSSARAHNWPIAAVIPIIIALNYIPFVVWNLQRGCLLGLNIVLIVVWHFLLGMLVSAWVNTCITDPGVPPERWQRQMVQEQVRSPHSTPPPPLPPPPPKPHRRFARAPRSRPMCGSAVSPAFTSRHALTSAR